MLKHKHILSIIAATGGILIFAACSEGAGSYQSESKVKVGFATSEGIQSKASLDATNGNFSWETNDQIALWAMDGSGSFVLQNQVFSLLATGGASGSAYFVSELDRPMEEGQYSYYLTSPVPSSVDGTQLTFALESVQNGYAGEGNSITISAPVTHGALETVSEASPIPSVPMKIRMKHLLHYLRFYIPQGCNTLGEKIEKITFTMPQGFCGTVSANLLDGGASLLNAENEMTLLLEQGVDEGGFVSAGIFPPSSRYGEGDLIEVTLYSKTKMAKVPAISLNGRNFEAGHITSVPLRPGVATDYYSLSFALASNNLGEDINSVRLTLPEGTNWPETDSNVYLHTERDGSRFIVQESFEIHTEQLSEFTALSGKTVLVSYDSDNAVVSQTVTLPALGQSANVSIELNCPYLFEQDFSNASTAFNRNGDLNASGHSMDTIEGSSYGLAGWTGNQVAIVESGGNKALAIRHQNETYILQGTYRGRADSAPMSAIKPGKTVKVNVSFDYTGYASGKYVPQLTYGHTTDQSALAGYYEGGSAAVKGGTKISNAVESQISAPTNGSISSVNIHKSFQITNCGNQVRLSWDCYGEKGGFSTTKEWIFIDNVRVNIVK